MTKAITQLQCPIPIQRYPVVTLAHGGGGTLMHQLIDQMFRPTFSGTQKLGCALDSAILQSPGGRLAFTTDSYVVSPLFFPGGNIGSMAVHGTINDLAMNGARPRWMSASFIIEEGFPMEELWRVVSSMAEAARESGVEMVTGDTKVVDRGKGDGIFINTSGIGVLIHDQVISPQEVRAGDSILISGDLGRHGVAILGKRQGLEFESTIESDSAPLWEPIKNLLENKIRIRALRDCTRGGLATTANEIAQAAGLTVVMDEMKIPVEPEVQGACAMLGLDPLYVANEGRFVLFVPQEEEDRALAVLRATPISRGAQAIGKVEEQGVAAVVVRHALGNRRILPMLSGEQLPRIC